jgi:hypothetical protein
MELQIAQITLRSRIGEAKIGFSKNGVIVVNKAASTMLKISEKRKFIEFASDKKSPGDWYIRVVAKSDGGAMLREINNRSWGFNNKAMAAQVIEDYDGKKSFSVRLAGSPVDGDFYALLMSTKKETISNRQKK